MIPSIHRATALHEPPMTHTASPFRPIVVRPRATLLAAACAGVLALASPGRASDAVSLVPSDSPAIQILSGQWDMTVPRAKVICRIQLNLQKRQPELFVGIPAPCKTAIRALVPVQTWAITTRGELRLQDQRGATVLAFARSGQGVLKAQQGADEITLQPVSGRYLSQERLDAVDQALLRLSTPDVEDQRTPTRIAGTYALARGPGQPELCTITFDRTLPGPTAGSGKASLDARCDDRGLRTFDPAGWIVERDRFFLIARRGHRTGFNIERDGSLVKDPPQGSPLIARRVQQAGS
jgi:transcription termination factor NusB